MKKLLGIPLLFVAGFTHAVPNVWEKGWEQGFATYSIEDSKGNTLWIYCNGSAGDNYDHSARFETPKKAYENTDSKYPLTFLFDGQKQAAPSATTNWRNGANAWYQFSQGIAKAKKIDVYINNKKVTTFTPTPYSIKTEAKGIAQCKAKF